jgi:hypothetical protein
MGENAHITSKKDTNCSMVGILRNILGKQQKSASKAVPITIKEPLQ